MAPQTRVLLVRALAITQRRHTVGTRGKVGLNKVVVALYAHKGPIDPHHLFCFTVVPTAHANSTLLCAHVVNVLWNTQRAVTVFGSCVDEFVSVVHFENSPTAGGLDHCLCS